MSNAKWAEDTPEKLAVSLRAEQCDDIANLLAAYVAGAGPDPKEKRGRRKVLAGHKPLPTHAIPVMKPVGSSEDGFERRKYAIRLGDATHELRRAVNRYGADSTQAKEAATKVRRAAHDEREP